jgi:glycosyltransferase involved in cell wall biosynthesis
MDRVVDFSILTPAYNASAFIRETIESVQAQTWPSFELLIVDDGSTDGTAEIAAGYARTDPRIRVLRQHNGGAAAARNAAIAVSSGKYFALIDSDDCWTPDYLETQAALFDAHPELDVISANAINRGGSVDGRLWREADHSLVPVTLHGLLAAEDSFCVLAAFRREVAERLGGFDGSLRKNEDYDFWIRAAATGHRLAFYGRPLAYYRRRSESLSSNEAEMLDGILRVLANNRPLITEPDDVALVDRKMASYEKRRLISSARSSLLERDFGRAASDLDQLQARYGGLYGVMAQVTRRAPHLLLWAYSVRSSLHPRARALRPRQ